MRDLNAAVLHVCTQKDRIQGLVDWEERQNGQLKRLGDQYEKLDEKLDLVLERIPHDLHTRLRAVEGDSYRRSGATGMLKWLLGLAGVGTLIAGYNFILEKSTPLEDTIHSGGLDPLQIVLILVILASVVGLFAYLIRKR